MRQRCNNFRIDLQGRLASPALCAFAVIALAANAAGQRIAFIVPEETRTMGLYANVLSTEIANHAISVIDAEAARSAFAAVRTENVFNLSTVDARRIGQVIGTDVFVLMRGTTLRRSSFARPVYYEASATVFLVSSRTGRLAHWRLKLSEHDSPELAESALLESGAEFAAELAAECRKVMETDLHAGPGKAPPELLDPDSPAALGLRPPLPYRRIKPDYTPQAYLFDIRATVDILVDIAADGTVTGTDIVRWAGYGLDESVEAAVRKMNWRPAERNGKTLPMRVLLRYNFQKIENDES
jgi:TonB family protein